MRFIGFFLGEASPLRTSPPGAKAGYNWRHPGERLEEGPMHERAQDYSIINSLAQIPLFESLSQRALAEADDSLPQRVQVRRLVRALLHR